MRLCALPGDDHEKNIFHALSHGMSKDFNVLLGLRQEILDIKDPVDADNILDMWSSKFKSLDGYCTSLNMFCKKYPGNEMLNDIKVADFILEVRSFLDTNKAPSISSNKQQEDVKDILAQLDMFSKLS